MDRPHFIYLFIHWWTFGLFPPFSFTIQNLNKFSSCQPRVLVFHPQGDIWSHLETLLIVKNEATSTEQKPEMLINVPQFAGQPHHKNAAAVTIQLLSRVWLSVILRTVAQSFSVQAFLSMRFSRQEYQSGLPISSSRGSSQSRDWIHINCIAGGFFTAELSGKPSPQEYSRHKCPQCCGRETLL